MQIWVLEIPNNGTNKKILNSPDFMYMLFEDDFANSSQKSSLPKGL